MTNYKSNFISIHIQYEKVWPSNWSPIRPERTHRPSLLVISDTDNNKVSWVVKEAKALLPQCEGSGIKLFCRENNNKESSKVCETIKKKTSNSIIKDDYLNGWKVELWNKIKKNYQVHKYYSKFKCI